MNRLTLTPTVALALALAAMSVPASAASYIPLGPKTYTPQPDLVTPNPDLVVPQDPTVIPQDPTVTVIPAKVVGNGSSEPHQKPAPQGYGEPGTNRWFNVKCNTLAYVNADCVAATMNPGSGGSFIPAKTTVTANPDLVIPNPDLVIPQPPTVTPQPPTCSQPGWSLSGGLGNYAC